MRQRATLWLQDRDSNPDLRGQSAACCHYTIPDRRPQYTYRLPRTPVNRALNPASARGYRPDGVPRITQMRDLWGLGVKQA